MKDMIFTSYSNSGETPLDIMLKKWKYGAIKKFIEATQDWQEVNFSLNSLNEIIGNSWLNQEQIEELISLLGSKKYRNKGYTELVMNEKINSFGKVIKAINGDSIIVFDKTKLIMAIDGNNSFPLLGYLNRFKDKCKLEIVDELFFKAVERKNVKKLLLTSIKHYGSQKQFPVNEGTKEIVETVMKYHQPLIDCIARITHGDVLSYMVDKLFINSFRVGLWRDSNKYKGFLVQKHFLEIYSHSKNLE